jgi:magnesium transporter
MTSAVARISDELNQRFFVDYPMDAARKIEQLPVAVVAEAIARLPAKVVAPVWENLLPETAARMMSALPDALSVQLLAELPPSRAVRILGFMPEAEMTRRVSGLDPTLAEDLETLLSYRRDTAGRMMNTVVSTFRRDATVADTLQRLRDSGMTTARSLFLVDDEQHLTGKVSITTVALSQPEATLGMLEEPIVAAVRPIDSLSEITEILQSGRILDLPVIDLDGVLLGAITHDDLARTIQKDATLDLQTMVGASKDERALSSPFLLCGSACPGFKSIC